MAAAATGPEQATTYRRLYELMPDPLAGEYTELFTPFSPDSAQQLAQLRDTVFQAARNLPHVFLYLTEDGGSPVIRSLHHPMKYASTLGVTMPWDDERHAFATDIAGGLITTVGWPGTAFHLTQAVRAPTIANMVVSWAAATGTDCLGPYTAADADTEEVGMRFLMPVPPAYAAMVVGRSIMPQNLWNELGATIINDGHEAACMPLLNWIRVSSTYQPTIAPAVDPRNPASFLTDALTPPLGDDCLNNRIRSWIQEDLPALTCYEGSVGESVAGALALIQEDAEN